MSLTIRPLHPVFAAEVTGLNLAEPMPPQAVQQVVAAMDTYAVCVFPDQVLSDEQQIAFTAQFGALETVRKANNPTYRHRLDLRVNDISNLGLDNKILPPNDRIRMSDLGNRLWHTDTSFKATPAKYSLLSARQIPTEGGDTQFADLRAAYDALPEKKKREIEGLVALHSVMFSRAKIGFNDFAPEEYKTEVPVPQLIVRTLPGSGRKTLYLASHAGEVEGMPVPEGKMLLHDLIDHATQPQFVYTHRWRVNDLVMWDDRCTMHRGREYDMDQARDLHRTTVADIGPTVEQERALVA